MWECLQISGIYTSNTLTWIPSPYRRPDASSFTIADVCVCLQFGKPEYMCYVRHKDPKMCALGLLGMYLIQKYTLNSVPFPDMCNIFNWDWCVATLLTTIPLIQTRKFTRGAVRLFRSLQGVTMENL